MFSVIRNESLLPGQPHIKYEGKKFNTLFLIVYFILRQQITLSKDILSMEI